MHLPKPSRCFIGWCWLILLVALGSATVHAERFLYSFSGRVRSIDDHYGVLVTSNYYRTGDVVSASFIVDVSRPGYQILNDGSRFVMSWYLVDYFYCRMISGPLLPDFHAEWASYPKAARHILYGGNQTHIFTNAAIVSRSAFLAGGSTASYFEIYNGDRFIQDWYEGMNAFGFATAAIDMGGGLIARTDMRLDSITPAPNLHVPEPVPSVPQAINIPKLMESTNYTFFILGGRTPYTRVRLNASPSTDGDGDPLFFSWYGLLRPAPVMGDWAYGEAPVINLRPGTQALQLRASDGTLMGYHDLSLTIYTPAQATDLMRNAIRALPGSTTSKSSALMLLRNAAGSFRRADWRRGLQFLQAFEQFMARSAHTIPAADRTSFINLSRAIRRAVAQPQ